MNFNPSAAPRWAKLSIAQLAELDNPIHEFNPSDLLLLGPRYLLLLVPSYLVLATWSSLFGK